MLELTREGDVFALSLDHGENHFRPDFMDAWSKALAEDSTTTPAIGG